MGNTEEYRTPFFKGVSPSTLVERWKRHLQPLESSWPGLLQFELDLGKKVGPLSIQKPLKDRILDIEAYYKGILLPSRPLDDSALDAVIRKWNQARGLAMRSTSTTWDLMKKSTSSGSPKFVKRKLVARETQAALPVESHSTGDLWDKKGKTTMIQIKDQNSDQLYCAILGWRGQEGGPKPSDVKQRVVWMFPAAVNLQELRVYQVITEVAQKFNLVPPWNGDEFVDREITELFRTKADSDPIVCTDFTKFDQHFNEDLQKAGHNIIQRLFNDSPEMVKWLRDVYGIKYSIPLLVGDGLMYFGHHGMGSGSGGTNADETLVHSALQYEAALSHGSTLNPHSLCLGDDGILTYPGITVEDVMDTYTSHGLEMNASKQMVSTQECVFLRRWHSKNYTVNGICRGVYATTRALGRLCEQERYYDPEKWSREMVALRQLSILENVKWHPLKEQFVDFCLKGDKYRLGLDLPGFLDRITLYAKESMEIRDDFLGYSQSQTGERLWNSISDWWIVKYLKSLR
nr:MAG: RNA-dependent RNA polymerase [nabpantry virus 12]